MHAKIHNYNKFLFKFERPFLQTHSVVVYEFDFYKCFEKKDHELQKTVDHVFFKNIRNI